MSPAATLDDVSAAEASLHAADELFFERGVAGVAMAEIRDRSGVSLRRLYSMYPSKSDLVASWLHHRHHLWMKRFSDHVDRRLDQGDDPIDAAFSALEAWMTDTNFRGCGFINTFAESSELTDKQHEIIRSHKRALATYLGTLTPAAPEIAVLVDGAIVQAAIFGNAEPIHAARRAARVVSAEAAK